jgi:hypothetical protein
LQVDKNIGMCRRKHYIWSNEIMLVLYIYWIFYFCIHSFNLNHRSFEYDWRTQVSWVKFPIKVKVEINYSRYFRRCWRLQSGC